MSAAPPFVDTPEWKAEDKGPSILIVCWLFTAISTLFVLGRVYVRGVIQRQLHSDDWFIILGQVCGYISTALSTVAVSYGNGRHFALLDIDQKQNAILWTTAAFVPGIFSFGLPKLAVVSLLVRLMNPSRFHKWFLWWIGIWCQLTLVVTAALLLGRCRPARSLWTFSIKGECFSNDILVAYCIYAGAFSAFADAYLAVYPAWTLFGLQLSLKKKIALSCALGIGSVSAIVAIYKTTRIPSLGSADFSYDTSDLVIWTVVEGSAIIIAASIPVMQPLVELIFKRNPFSSNKGGDKTSDYYNNRGGRSGNSPMPTFGGSHELTDRKRNRPKRDELGFTIVEDDSQEDILAADNNHNKQVSQKDSFGSAITTNTQAVSTNRQGGPPTPTMADGKIFRTDVVTVEYEQPQQPPRMRGSWNRV